MGNSFSNTERRSSTVNQPTEYYSNKVNKCNSRNLERLNHNLRNNNISDMLQTIDTLQNNTSTRGIFDTENILSSIRDSESYAPHNNCGCQSKNKINRNNVREIMSDSFFDSDAPQLRFNFKGREANNPYVLWK